MIPPSITAKLLDRDLIRHVDTVLARPLTVVRAPAGYGKTTMLAQWYHRLRQRAVATVWLSLDEFDTDPALLLAYIAETLRRERVLSANICRDELNAGADPDRVLIAGLIDGILQHRAPVAMFFDDLHLLRNPDARCLVNRLIVHSPPNLHLVLASREAAIQFVGRQRLRGNALEITSRDLSLSRAEIEEYLAQNGFADLDDPARSHLESSTEGWIAGIKFAVSGLGPSYDRNRAIRSLHGSRRQIAEFFAHDVLNGLPADIQDFLLKSSILAEFSAGLAESVTGRADAQAIIAKLEAAGLFIFTLGEDETWFRYHQLFAGYLLHELEMRYPGIRKTLHLKASRWYADEGLSEEAFIHALKGDDAVQAAEILDDCCCDILYDGRPGPLLGMIERLPEHVLAQFPRLMLTKAWSAVVHWQFEEAARLLDMTEAILDKKQSDGVLPERDLVELRALFLHRKMIYQRFRDDIFQEQSYCDKLLSGPSINDSTMLGTIYDTLIHVEADQFNFSRIDYLERTTRDLLQRRGNVFMMVWHKATIGRARLMSGESDEAIAAYREGARCAAAIAPMESTLAAVPSLLLAEALYLRNEILEAKQLCATYFSLVTAYGLPEQLISAYTVQSRLLRNDGKQEEAQAVLDAGIKQALAQRFQRLKIYLTYEKVLGHLQQGNLNAARALFARFGLDEDRSEIVPKGKTTVARERQALLWTRMALAEGKVADARSVAMHWRDFAHKAGATLSEIQWDILLALIHLRDGNVQAATRNLRRAVLTAGPGRYLRLFLDEGAPIMNLVAQLDGALGPVSGSDAVFAQNLLAAADPSLARKKLPDVPMTVHGTLGARELEIMRLIADGLSNREIGQRLGMTEGTVKWHLQQTYDKLGVRRRQLAVDKARRLGLVGHH